MKKKIQLDLRKDFGVNGMSMLLKQDTFDNLCLEYVNRNLRIYESYVLASKINEFERIRDFLTKSIDDKKECKKETNYLKEISTVVQCPYCHIKLDARRFFSIEHREKYLYIHHLNDYSSKSTAPKCPYCSEGIRILPYPSLNFPAVKLTL